MFTDKVGSVVIRRAERSQVGVTRLAGVRSLHTIVASTTRGHLGQLHGDSNLRFFNAFVTRLALDLLLLDVEFMREDQRELWRLGRPVRGRIAARMAVRAIRLQLVIMAGLAIHMLGQQIVGRKLAGRCGRMAVRTSYSCLLHVKTMGKFHPVRLILGFYNFMRRAHHRECNNHYQSQGKHGIDASHRAFD